MSKAPQKVTKNPAAVALGRLGGQKGGRATAKKLTAEQRSQSASNAAKARAKKLSKAQRSAIARKASKARWERSNYK